MVKFTNFTTATGSFPLVVWGKEWWVVLTQDVMGDLHPCRFIGVYVVFEKERQGNAEMGQGGREGNCIAPEGRDVYREPMLCQSQAPSGRHVMLFPENSDTFITLPSEKMEASPSSFGKSFRLTNEATWVECRRCIETRIETK